MEEGAPPPWLINMQRYGPPPSYPNLKIPGLNAPIPQGSQFGFHPGGWGKPPVDEYGNPLYGDVFGVYDQYGGTTGRVRAAQIAPCVCMATLVTSTPLFQDLGDLPEEPWGELQEQEEEVEMEVESEEEPSEDEDEEEGGGSEGEEEEAAGEASSASLAAGLATPDTLDLRKGQKRLVDCSMAVGSEAVSDLFFSMLQRLGNPRNPQGLIQGP